MVLRTLLKTVLNVEGKFLKRHHFPLCILSGILSPINPAIHPIHNVEHTVSANCHAQHWEGLGCVCLYGVVSIYVDRYLRYSLQHFLLK